MAANYKDVIKRFSDSMPMDGCDGHIVLLPSNLKEAVVLFNWDELEEEDQDKVMTTYWPDLEESEAQLKDTVLFGALGVSGWFDGEWMSEFAIYGSLLLDLNSGENDDCPVLWYQTRDEEGEELEEPKLINLGPASALVIKEGSIDDD